MTSSAQMDGSRGRARPGRGLMRPPFPPHKVYPASGNSTVLSISVHGPLSRHVIAGPLGVKQVQFESANEIKQV